jgi:hypothetical protein
MSLAYLSNDATFPTLSIYQEIFKKLAIWRNVLLHFIFLLNALNLSLNLYKK